MRRQKSAHLASQLACRTITCSRSKTYSRRSGTDTTFEASQPSGRSLRQFYADRTYSLTHPFSAEAAIISTPPIPPSLCGTSGELKPEVYISLVVHAHGSASELPHGLGALLKTALKQPQDYPRDVGGGHIEPNFANNEMEDRPMRKVTLAVITVAVAAGATSIYGVSNSSGDRLIPGSGPITEQQIRDKLTAEGFSKIQITLRGSVFETVPPRMSARPNWRSIRPGKSSAKIGTMTTTIDR